MMRDYYKKMPGDRKDGWKLRNVPLFFTVVPFIMRTRLDSQDYYAETLDAEPMMDFMKAHKEDIPNLSMMTIFVAAMVRMISQRPALNRFVVHNKLYAHNSIEISIAIKRNMSDDGEETIKPSFDPRDTLPDVQRRLEEAITEAMNHEEGTGIDGVAGWLGKLPAFLFRFAVSLIHFLDNNGWLPRKLTQASPWHCSAMFTNVGSLGIGPIYHHLTELGTYSCFIAMGKRERQTVYDENGNKVKSFQYNSLDTSSKIYTESKYAENGQVTADLDETGEVSAEYEYIEGTTIVRSVKYPNGSRFAYGHDAEDSVTAITQSTAIGEENSTQTYYTCGEVTKLVSGNNTVKYEYDGEHRITAIDLNETEDYETYSYSEGDTEDSVTVTNAKNETFTMVTDKKGQILRVQYGDVTQVSYTYDADGNVLTAADGVTGENESSTYDSLGNCIAYTRGSYSESYTYDVYGKIASFVQGARTYSYAYKNNAARDLDHITVEGLSRQKQGERDQRSGRQVCGRICVLSQSGRPRHEYAFRGVFRRSAERQVCHPR